MKECATESEKTSNLTRKESTSMRVVGLVAETVGEMLCIDRVHRDHI